LLLDAAAGKEVASGKWRVASKEFSSSEYAKAIAGIVAGEPPAIDLAAEKRLQDCLVAFAATGLVNSAHDLSDGGLAVALAESCFATFSLAPASAGGILGTSVNLDDSAPSEYALFGESGARAIVSVSPEKLAAVLATARQYSVGAQQIGNVTRDNGFRIEYNRHVAVAADVPALRSIWANSLEFTIAVLKP
jgi:phosphoribosylformylglycinamidine synthase